MSALIHTTTGAEVTVRMEGGGMRFKPQERVSYATRVALHQAKLNDLEKRCLKEAPVTAEDGTVTMERCKGYRIKTGLYCSGHQRQADRIAAGHAHEDFTEATPVGAD